MALIECYECKGKVSSEAKACPHCGLPIEVEIDYYDDGQMSRLIFLKDGKRHGLRTHWYENGQKAGETNFKDGKADGLWTFWYENGQKKEETNWKNDKIMSAEVWKPNGEECPVTDIDKDGNGVVAWYEDNGTDSIRYTYKDGKLVFD